MKTYPAIAIAALAGGCASFTGERFDMDAAQSGARDVMPSQWAVELPETPAQGDWVGQFSSPELRAVIDEALSANPDIAAAYATAQAAAHVSRSTYGRSLPSLSATLNSDYSAYGNGIPLDNTEGFDWGLSTSWEVDVWGRVSRTIRAARADQAAAEGDLAALQLSLAGAAARSWVSLSSARALLTVAEDELSVRESSQTLTERRFSAGVSTSLDVRLARSATASARANIASARRSVEDAARNLEVLLGRYPSAEITAPMELPILPAMSSIGSPETLLARRPDIAAAEARMAAAGLRADAARLAMRPALTLSATGGVGSEKVEDLVDIDLIAGRVLANLTAPIFRGGALKAESEAALARARAAAWRYESAVLGAWNEVEGARSADIWFAAQETALLEALDEAKAAEILAERQYQSGLISIFNLIDAQSRRISAQRQIINVRAARAANRITYHLALGGGAETLPEATDGTE